MALEQSHDNNEISDYIIGVGYIPTCCWGLKLAVCQGVSVTVFLKIIYSIGFCILLLGCGSDDNNSNTPEPDNSVGGPTEEEIIKIPVVVHVIYYNDETNITTEKIESQIAVLNEDFRKLNADYTQTPDEFLPLVADAGIEFELATIDPEGNDTDGITRTYSSEVDGWSGRNFEGDKTVEELSLFFTDAGGQDAWPTDQYLNIWVADMSNHSGVFSLAGYAMPVGSDPRIDGVVVETRVFGLHEPLMPYHSMGRTTTHEIGHWLNLNHIYGRGGKCDEDDGVSDTPIAENPSDGFPSYPRISCGSVDNTMNFMDNQDDRAMYMFTLGQRERMRGVFKEGGGRHQFYLNSLTYFAE